MRIIDKRSSGNSLRYIFGTDDDSIVEAAVFEHKNQFHLCVSTQVGCPVGCRHCATTYALVQYLRNLTIEELSYMIEFALNEMPRGAEKVLSFSGHGEPSLNWKTVTGAKMAFQHRFQRFYVTSIGNKACLVDIINNRQTDFTFYLSLHGSTDNERSLLIPNSTRFSTINDLFNFINEYSLLGGEIVVNYMLHLGNSSPESLGRLLCLLEEANQNVSLRFTDYNSVGPESGIIRLRHEQIQEALAYIKRKRKPGSKWNYRYSFLEGQDIQIACGQLRAGMLTKGDVHGSFPSI